MKKFLTIPALFFLILSFVPATGSAALIIPLDTAFSAYGPEDPEYKDNYGNVTIKYYTPDSVEFTIKLNTETLGDGAYVSKFYFNTDSNFYDNLILTPDDSSAANLTYNFNIEDSYHKPDGDGYFDGVINFGTEKSTQTFVLSGTNLDETDFLAQSFGGHKGHFTIAAQIKKGNVGYVGGNPVPIPSTILLLGTGLVGLVGFRRKKQ